MSTGFDFKKLQRLIIIHLVVQIILVVLLIYIALQFQAGLGPLFWKSIIIMVIIMRTRVTCTVAWSTVATIASSARFFGIDDLHARRLRTSDDFEYLGPGLTLRRVDE